MQLKSAKPARRLLIAGIAAAGLALGAMPASADTTGSRAFVGNLAHNTTVASTIPANGDVNPYGVAVVPETHNSLIKGDVLVSNFNNAPTVGAPGGLQGTGTTLVEISPTGQRHKFATIPATDIPGGVGLTTALVVLRSGWVIVGSLPTADGTSATASSGALIVLDSTGNVRETIAGHGINGPWDATALDLGEVAELFVSNVLPGIVHGTPATTTRGDVVRLVLDLRGATPKVLLSTVVANGLAVRTDPAALIIGPTGLALRPDGTLLVADTVNSRIAAIPDATFRLRPVDAGLPGATFSADPHLAGPLGLALAPNGDLLSMNAADNNIVELTPTGSLAAVRNLDAVDPPGGALFGLAVSVRPAAVYYVNDDTNTLNVLK